METPLSVLRKCYVTLLLADGATLPPFFVHGVFPRLFVFLVQFCLQLTLRPNVFSPLRGNEIITTHNWTIIIKEQKTALPYNMIIFCGVAYEIYKTNSRLAS